MYKTSKLFFTAILFSTFTFSNSVVAKECYEPSPNLEDSADDYYNLDDTVKLSNQERNQLKSFFRSIKGQWKGKLAYIECRGPDRAPRTITKDAIVTAKTTLVSSEKVSVNAKKNYTQASVKKHESFSLFNAKNIYTVEFHNNNTLIFSERYRRTNNFVADPRTAKNKKTVTQARQVKKYKNPNEVRSKTQTTKSRTSRFTETIYEVSLNKNLLTLLRSFYTNGVYTGEEKWSMHAD